jgi:hypothetical protein
MDALPVTVTQQWGIFGNLFFSLSRTPRYEARTQHLESVQKATKATTIRKKFRFEYDEKGARTGICSSICLRAMSGPSPLLERFQAKWTPVRVKKTRQIKNLEPRFDSIEAEKALVQIFKM